MRRFALLAFFASACVVEPDVGSTAQPLVAHCEATVEGTGVVDVEGDYLPHVVQCENGAAAFEALKAQAVAARTYLYYKLDHAGSVTDGTGDQVYSCGRAPSAEHYEAVRQTEGVVLRYAEQTIAGFFVAGARDQPAPECRGSTDDPTNTERYVTYNEGLAGDEITQTPLGWVNPGNDANRGCMSQNGSHCLAGQGWGYEDILRFYYGADIEIARAEGACVEPVDAGVEDAGVEEDAGAAIEDADVAPDAGPYVEVEEPDDSLEPLSASGGCAAGGGGGGVMLALLTLVARRRRP